METATLTDADGIEITWYRWLPEGQPRGVVHVLHGWAEHASRYDRLARACAEAGLAVYADDHRGHGRTGLAAAGGLGDLGPRGMDGVLDAVRGVSEVAFGNHPGRPRLLLGHSWGSFLAQRYLRRWGAELAGAVLTGTTLRRPDAPPRTGSLNDAFEPAATPYDWLSRDPAEVQAYVDDPWCGFERMATRPAAVAAASPGGGEPDDTAVPPDLPILIANGSADPVGGAEGGAALAEHYRSAGVRSVDLRLYEGGRHELLNETNRDEVTAELIAWLAARL
ncbi:MAG TPA: alpha/beta hydrolase [Acidimicrobiales bacterium]|nr:alpha/beta hydrolase [Acidimicrobiales bacterium]